MPIPTTPGRLRRARTRITRTLLAATATVATVTLSAAAAPSGAGAEPPPDGHRAGEDERIRAAGGTAWFSHHDEIVKVDDTRRDGLGVRAYFAGIGTSIVTDRGAGGKPESLDLSVPEGQKVLLKLCYIDEFGLQAGCSDSQAAIA
jgi:hypothetical protein